MAQSDLRDEGRAGCDVQSNPNISEKTEFLPPLACSYYLAAYESRLRKMCIYTFRGCIDAVCRSRGNQTESGTFQEYSFPPQLELAPSSFPLRSGSGRHLPLEHFPVG